MPRFSVFHPALPLAAALVVGACAAAPEDAGSSDAAPAPAEEPAPPAASGSGLSAYPELYRSMGLPTLPDATITSTGRQTTSLRDGLAIRLTTPLSVAETRDFYRTAMIEAGWIEEAPPNPAAAALELPVARVAFAKGSVSYSALLTAADGGTQVAINVMEP